MRNIIFDLGAVMVEWNPPVIVANYTADKDLQRLLMAELYEHSDWLDLDRGTLSEQQLIANVALRTGLTVPQVDDLLVQTKQSLLAIDSSVETLYAAKTAGLKVYCLSNICEPFFTFLTERYDFFQQLDGAIVSAREKTIKPEPAIFQRLLERYSLNSEYCLFVDDRLDNIESAQALGFQTVHFSGSADCYQAIYRFINSG